jgi:hypothetical protein
MAELLGRSWLREEIDSRDQAESRVTELHQFAARRVRREAQWRRLHPFVTEYPTIHGLAVIRRMVGRGYLAQRVLEMHRERRRWQGRR